MIIINNDFATAKNNNYYYDEHIYEMIYISTEGFKTTNYYQRRPEKIEA